MSTYNQNAIDELRSIQAKLDLGLYYTGDYDEIVSIKDGGLNFLENHFDPCLPETYIDFDKKGRGGAQNIDLYGLDADQNVAVYQIRLVTKRYANSFRNIKKSYVLVGFNDETGEPFRHPVGAHKIRVAAKKPNAIREVVKAAQQWMWGVNPKQLDRALAASQRQGDVLLLKEYKPSKDAIECELENGCYPVGGNDGSHLVKSEKVFLDGDKLLAYNPTLIHRKEQHCHVFAGEGDGWYSVRLAYEADSWDFAARFGD